MKRRDAIINLSWISAGLLLVPACQYKEEKAAIALNNLNINKNQEVLLKDLVDTILPEGDMPGGISLNVHHFVWTIIDDCTTKENQAKFLNGLSLFNSTIETITGQPFSQLDAKQKDTTINQLMQNSQADHDLIEFLNKTKYTAIWGYTNSEYFLTQQMPYKLVPGPFSYKTITINPQNKININA